MQVKKIVGKWVRTRREKRDVGVNGGKKKSIDFQLFFDAVKYTFRLQPELFMFVYPENTSLSVNNKLI